MWSGWDVQASPSTRDRGPVLGSLNQWRLAYAGSAHVGEKGEIMLALDEFLRGELTDYALTFIRNPYLCYTEHGLHALFYATAFSRLDPEQRYAEWFGQKVCVLQKEYATSGSLGKPRRQHWDIALLKTPLASSTGSYDHLRLAAAIEFGLNEGAAHLVDDIERLCHPDANTDRCFIVHLYRLSAPGAPFSGRDWSSGSKQILTPQQIAGFTMGKPVEVFYGLYDGSGRYVNAAWTIANGAVRPLCTDGC